MTKNLNIFGIIRCLRLLKFEAQWYFDIVSMQFKRYETIDKKLWDLEVLNRSKNLNLLSHFINYKSITGNLKQVGGIVYSGQELVAIYQLFIDLTTNSVVNPNPAPLISDGIDDLTLKRAHDLFLNSLITEYKIDCVGTKIFEIDNWEIEEASSYFIGEKKLIGFNMIVPLNQSADAIFSALNRNHKRSIKNSTMQGQKVLIINNSQNSQLIDFYFDAYRKCHYMAAGRQTRSDASFQCMINLIYEGISTLFVTVLNNDPIAFLYCDHTYNLSRGWSQATSIYIPKEIFPRTLLEWTAIKHFRDRGCSLYHLGSYHSEVRKDIFPGQGYMEFKRRFGPEHVPIFSVGISGELTSD